MLIVALVLVLLGILMLLVVPWVGVPAGLVGLALFVVWLFGVLRGSARGGPAVEAEADAPQS